jgi:hypothetical protein
VRRALLSLVVASLAVAAWLLVHGVGCSGEGLVMLAPALAFAVPLLAGRYVGERTIHRVRAARAGAPTARRRSTAAAPRRRPSLALVPRGGLLLASSLATRPPPALS